MAMARQLGCHFSSKRPWIRVLAMRWTQFDTFQRRHENHQIASQANQGIDFRSIELKWHNKWHSRGVGTRHGQLPDSRPPSLTPFYLSHLRPPTSILEILECHYARTSFDNQNITVLDRVCQLSPPKLDEKGQYVHSHGVDVIRTSLVFSGWTPDGIGIGETDIQLTQKWFELIWKAVSMAHDSYISTQRCPDEPIIPDALYKPGIESFLDYISEEHLRFVQVPPEEPKVSRLSTDPDEYRLWLIAQKSILAYKAPITVQNSLRRIRLRLIHLATAIIAYHDATLVSCNMHYYAARILLSLLAPLAPSYAEECWLHLHYGYQNGDRDGSELTYDFDENLQEEIEEIIQETEDNLNRRHLPRQGQPHTLQSIFDQPFPIVRLCT
ncbi:hypothetical protein F5Y19DRAFT_431791 [Xylariaceae sp. FL1651]|nr:hypothetical protein F5Y19DRAFT_431791 [Xylariaceae sp. FL1651]